MVSGEAAEHLDAVLAAAAVQDRFSHFYLVSGGDDEGRRAFARRLAEAMLCESQGSRPCGVCPACRKVLSGSHPDLITVDDPSRKTVPVELVRQAREDVFIRPNEGRRKIYVFPRAQDLGLPGQNALLKVLEEPPAYGVFLLLADNPARLLPTVRSRCTELKLPPAKQAPEAPLPQTERFAAAYAARDPVALLALLTSMEKCKRDELSRILTQWQDLLASALRARLGAGEPEPAWAGVSAAHSPRELRSAVERVARALTLLDGNVSPGAVCGSLLWELV